MIEPNLLAVPPFQLAFPNIILNKLLLYKKDKLSIEIQEIFRLMYFLSKFSKFCEPCMFFLLLAIF